MQYYLKEKYSYDEEKGTLYVDQTEQSLFTWGISSALNVLYAISIGEETIFYVYKRKEERSSDSLTQFFELSNEFNNMADLYTEQYEKWTITAIDAYLDSYYKE